MDNNKLSFSEIFRIKPGITKTADELKDLTSIVFQRNPDIPKKRFLVELEEGISTDFDAVVSEAGVSRNLLVNLLILYFIENKSSMIKELKSLAM